MRRSMMLMCFVCPSVVWADCGKMVKGHINGSEMLNVF